MNDAQTKVNDNEPNPPAVNQVDDAIGTTDPAVLGAKAYDVASTLPADVQGTFDTAINGKFGSI